MNPEKLAKLTPHTVDIGKAGRSAPEITAQDVLGAMSMARLTGLQTAILLSKFADHAPGAIWSHLMLWIGDYHPDWLGQGVIHHIARDAIWRHLGEDRCRQCEGTGEDWSVAPPKTCEACGGEKMTRRSYEGVWQVRYEDILYLLSDAEEDAIRRILL